MKPNDQPQSPKTQQYLDEINEVSARYQYSLVPTLKITNDGIIPVLNVIEVIPPKKVRKGGKK